MSTSGVFSSLYNVLKAPVRHPIEASLLGGALFAGLTYSLAFSASSIVIGTAAVTGILLRTIAIIDPESVLTSYHAQRNPIAFLSGVEASNHGERASFALLNSPGKVLAFKAGQRAGLKSKEQENEVKSKKPSLR